ncbi:MAG: hypothetical protein KIT14_15965 [bacterium]|nr:hypothetical protein [bacterium]
MNLPQMSVLTLVVALLVAAPSSSASAAGPTCRAVRSACGAAAAWAARACDGNCTRLGERPVIATCRAACRAARTTAKGRLPRRRRLRRRLRRG